MDDPFLLAIENRRIARDGERMAMNKRIAQLNAEADADAVAKRVYLEMKSAGLLADQQPAGDAKQAAMPDAVEPAPATEVQAAEGTDLMVKDMILLVLKEAYPNGMTAAQIKGKAWLRFRKYINPNTLTVSLGRFSKPKDGEPRQARCDGRTWYYMRERELLPPKSAQLALLNGGRDAAE